jgi:ribose transport system substrate-binding protein
VAAVLAATGLVLGACTSAEDADRSDQTSLVTANVSLSFSQEIEAGFRDGVGQVSSTAPLVDGPGIVDGNAELELFEAQVEANVGGAAVMTLNPDVFTSPIAGAVKAGLPVVAVDNPPLPTSGVSLYIGNDNVALGRMLADQVASRLPPNVLGDIVLGSDSPGQAVLDDRILGMVQEFHLRLPKVRLLGPFDTEQDVDANQKAWQILVTANPHALAFVGSGDADGWNLAAIKQRRHGTWLAGGFDLDPRSMKAVRAGDLLLVSPEHYTAGELAGHLLAAHATHGAKLPEGWIVVPGLAVTPANIDEIIARQSSAASRAAWFTPRVTAMLGDLDASLKPFGTIR